MRTAAEQLRHNKAMANSYRAQALTGVFPIAAEGWETVGVLLMDIVDDLQRQLDECHAVIFKADIEAAERMG